MIRAGKPPFLAENRRNTGTPKALGQTGLELGMEESYDEELAIHIGPNPYADDGNIVGGSNRDTHCR